MTIGLFPILEREHFHDWKPSPWVIDTIPPLSTWYCECGAETHNVEIGEVCEIKHFFG